MRFKFTAFLAFVATAGAITKIYSSTTSNGEAEGLSPIKKCGDTNLDYDVGGARIVYTGQSVIWFEKPGCVGQRNYVHNSVDCFAPTFTPRCVTIYCRCFF